MTVNGSGCPGVAANYYFSGQSETDLRVITSCAGSRKTTSFTSMGSTDASVSTEYHFSWKKW